MWTVMPSPVGDLRIVERDGSIVAIAAGSSVVLSEG